MIETFEMNEAMEDHFLDFARGFQPVSPRLPFTHGQTHEEVSERIQEPTALRGVRKTRHSRKTQDVGRSVFSPESGVCVSHFLCVAKSHVHAAR
jgi:hypothetical protein